MRNAGRARRGAKYSHPASAVPGQIAGNLAEKHPWQATSGYANIKLASVFYCLRSELELEALATGYAPKHYNVVPNANELVVQLTRAP